MIFLEFITIVSLTVNYLCEKIVAVAEYRLESMEAREKDVGKVWM